MTVVDKDGRLVVTVGDDGAVRAVPIIALADRVGRLGGALSTGPAGFQ